MARKKTQKKSILRRSKQLSAALRSVQLDEKILALAAKPYAQILKKIDLGKRRLDEERQLALSVGTRILEKARDVRDQIVTQAQKVPGVSYVVAPGKKATKRLKVASPKAKPTTKSKKRTSKQRRKAKKSTAAYATR